jgi:integral membrane protein (TIGR01906 family)
VKTINLIARVFFILCLSLLLLTASISGAVNCARLYQYGFEKYDVSQTTGIDSAELKKAAQGLIHYFNSREEPINLTVMKDGKPFTLFNQPEIIHLKDVKDLIHLGYRVLLGTFLYALAYVLYSLFWRRDKRRLAQGLMWGGGVTIATIVSLGLTAVLNFDQFFLQFHLLSFANDFWMLDPSRDYLIMLFPGGFWYDATLFIALGTLAVAVMMGVTGYFLCAAQDRRTIPPPAQPHR